MNGLILDKQDGGDWKKVQEFAGCRKSGRFLAVAKMMGNLSRASSPVGDRVRAA